MPFELKSQRFVNVDRPLRQQAELAQSVERTTLNRVVVGSIPPFGEITFLLKSSTQDLVPTKNVACARAGSRLLFSPPIFTSQAELAQSVERTTLNRVVVGSIPTFGDLSFALTTAHHLLMTIRLWLLVKLFVPLRASFMVIDFPGQIASF